MALPRFTRLESLLGVPLDDVEEKHLDQLVAGRVAEREDLDFKAVYGKGPSLATDVCALANATGGLIVVGMRDDSGVAVELAPIPEDDEAEVRFHQLLASYAAPSPVMTVVRVPSSQQPGHAYFLLVVHPSDRKPHAVVVDGKLRYMRRDGPHNRWMSEQEVADSFRARFTAAADRDARLSEVIEQGRSRFYEAGPPWLWVALVPEARGEFTIRGSSLRETRGLAMSFVYGQQLGRGMWAGHSLGVTVGLRRVVIAGILDEETGRSGSAFGELHSDGSIFVAMPMPVRPSTGQTSGIFDQEIEIAAVDMIRFAVEHPIQSGAPADCIAAAGLDCPAGLDLMMSVGPGFYGRISDTRPSQGPIEGRHSLHAQSIRSDWRETLAAAYILLTDIVQSFGLAEPRHITAQGELRLSLFEFPSHFNRNHWTAGFLVKEG